MKLITGHSGENHITADDDAAKFAALIGGGDYVLDKGSKFACIIKTNNSVEITEGEAIFQGRHFRMTPEEKKELVIDSGTQDQFRNDLICIKYTQIEGVENAEIVVVKGEPGREAVDPAYEVGNIETGKSVHHMPLYRIKLEGLNITGIEPMYKIYHRIPNFGYGTGEPSGGEDGDVYFKIIE